MAKTTRKTQGKKVIKKAKGSSKQTSRKATDKTNARNVKRNSTLRFSQLSEEEREIYRSFETLLKEDELQLKYEKKTKNVRGGKAIKGRGKNKNLFTIKLPARHMQGKINTIRNAKFTNIKEYLNRQPLPPLYIYATLKIKNPNEKNGYYYNGSLSDPGEHVDVEYVKRFMVETLVNYNNDSIDSIQEETHSGMANGGKVYNVSEISVRFLFYNK